MILDVGSGYNPALDADILIDKYLENVSRGEIQTIVSPDDKDEEPNSQNDKITNISLSDETTLKKQNRQARLTPKSVKKLQILMLSPDYPPDYSSDIGRHVYYLSSAMVQLGAKVNVISSCSEGCPEMETVEGVHIYRLPQPSFALDDAAMAVRLGELLPLTIDNLLSKHNAIDIIHAHDWQQALIGRRLQEICKVPLIISIHYLASDSSCIYTNTAFYPYQSYKLAQLLKKRAYIEKRMIADATHLILKSEYAYRRIKELLPENQQKIDLIPYGIPLDSKPMNLDLKKFREILASPEQAIVTYISKPGEESDIISFLRAIPSVDEKDSAIKFVIATHKLTPKTIPKEIGRLKLYDRFVLLNNVAGKVLSAIYKCTDILVVTAHCTLCNLIAMEGMAQGIPVIVSETGALNECIQHDVDGIKVPADRPDVLAEAILKMLHSSDLRMKLGEAAHKHIKKNHSNIHEAESTLKVYNQVREFW